MFFIAGYETTALTISYLMYLLAINPDIQEDLYREIITVAGDKVSFILIFSTEGRHGLYRKQ